MNSAPPAPAPTRAYPSRAPRRFDHSSRPQSRGTVRPGGVSRRIQRILRRPSANQTRAVKNADYFPEPAGKTTTRIIPLGGVEEVFLWLRNDPQEGHPEPGKAAEDVRHVEDRALGTLGLVHGDEDVFVFHRAVGFGLHGCRSFFRQD